MAVSTTHAAIWAAMAFAVLNDRGSTWDVMQLINPLNHSDSPDEIGVYRVEPFVVAADVYGTPPHVGRGGWTWYTGSAGWMYRLILESLVGVQREANKLTFKPCLPPEWTSVGLHYRFNETLYRITVYQTSEERSAGIRVDGVASDEQYLVLADDRHEHVVEVYASIGPHARTKEPSLAS